MRWDEFNIEAIIFSFSDTLVLYTKLRFDGSDINERQHHATRKRVGIRCICIVP